MVDYSEWNDEKLLKEYRQGNDPRIVEILFTRYADVGFRVAMRFMHNEADAEDILQSAFIQFLRDLHQFREGVSVKPWLMKMIVNNCKDKFKEEKRRIRREQKVISERFLQKPPESSEVHLEDNNTELQKKLRQSVDALPEKYRSPVWLVLYEEFSYREVASVLALPEKTIRTQVARGLEKLREKLESFGSMLSLTLIVEQITSSPLETAPVTIKQFIQSEKLHSIANSQSLNSTRKIATTKTSFSSWFLLTSSVAILLVIGFLYFKKEKKLPENIIVPKMISNMEVEKKPTFIHLNFNQKDEMAPFYFMGEYNYLEKGGIDDTGCIEIPKGFAIKIPVENLKLPLKISCRSDLKWNGDPGIVGYTMLVWEYWEKMGHFFNVSPYIRLPVKIGTYLSENSESKQWSTEIFWVTKNSIDSWHYNTRRNLYIVNQPEKAKYLYLGFYSSTIKIDEMVIETVNDSQIPDISHFQKVYEEIIKSPTNEENILKDFFKEKEFLNMKPKFIIYTKPTKEAVINDIKNKLTSGHPFKN